MIEKTHSAMCDNAAPMPVLEVLHGPRAGGSYQLDRGCKRTLSTGWNADIIVRDKGHPFRADVELGPDGMVRLHISEGVARLLGMDLAAGVQCLWPAFTPLEIGPNVLAHGLAGSPRWVEAAALAAGSAAPAAVANEPLDVAHRATLLWNRIPQRPRQFLSAGVAIAAIGAALVTAPSPGMPIWANGLPQAEQILADEGLDDAKIARTKSGHIKIVGSVADREAMARAVFRLKDAGIAHDLDVMVGDDLADAAQDIARLHGIRAQAVATGPDSIALSISPMPNHARAALIAAIRADLPMLRTIDVAETLAAADEAAPRTVSEAAKRISTVVAGDPGYVLTADGARYFAGALLPSGHILKAIEDSAILVERNGATTRIQF